MCPKIDEPDSAFFPTAPGLALQAALKKTKAQLDLLTDIHILLRLKKHVSGAICHSLFLICKT